MSSKEEENVKETMDSADKQQKEEKSAEGEKKTEKKEEKKDAAASACAGDDDDDEEISEELDEYGFHKFKKISRLVGPLKHTEVTAAMTKQAEEEWKHARDEYQTRGTLRSARKLACTLGIPMSYRSWAWQVLSGALELRAEHSKDTFQALSRDVPDPDNPVHTQIMLDLPRTFPLHAVVSSEKGKTEMFRVLSAVAALDTSVSYCQGMAFLVAVLLMVMPTEEAFWTMVAMLKLKGLDDFYRPGMPGIVRECLRFEKLLSMSNKKMDEHLKANGVSPVLYIVPWFLPMFTNLRDWTTIFRIWDTFMAEGISALHRVGLAVISTISGNIFGKDINGFLNQLINPVFPDGTNTLVFMKRVNTIAPDSLFTKANHALKSDEEFKSVTPKKSPSKRDRGTPAVEPQDESPLPDKKRRTERGSVTSWLKRALTPSRKNTPKAATPAKSSLSVSQPPPAPASATSHLRNPMVSPSKHAAMTPVTPPPAANMKTPPRMSPSSQEAFREFSTPSPIVSFRGKKYQMTPTSPVHPMMMELCTVSSFGDKLNKEEEDEEEEEDVDEEEEEEEEKKEK